MLYKKKQCKLKTYEVFVIFAKFSTSLEATFYNFDPSSADIQGVSVIELKKCIQ